MNASSDATYSASSDALSRLQQRGLVYQCTDIADLDERLASRRVTVYNGYDLTAPSLHVGNLVTIMMLRTLQRAGHRPIVLLGGGTTKIGDPSGKDEVRQLLDDETIATNRDRIDQVVRRFLDVEDPDTGALILDNAEWLDELKYIPFLRDVGPHFTVNRMLAMESVKRRIDREQPLSFLEFNYMVLQAYDFVELHRRHDCTLQTGGSDQWGNIVSGVELGRRMTGAELHGLTAPLLLTSDGRKMGKTADGAVWLSEDLMRPYDFWQYWRNVDDADVPKLLRMFTDLDPREIERLSRLEGREINDAKVVLATEVTRLVHGDDAAQRAADTAAETFDEGGAGSALPTVDVPRDDLEEGVPAFVLMGRAGLTDSNSAARRLIKQGGGRINDERIEDPGRSVTLADLDGDHIKLSAGKKRHALIKPV